MKIAKHEMKPMTIRQGKHKTPHNKGQKDKAARLAEEHNIDVSTLRKRKAKNPDVPLEVLAKQPVMTKRQAGSAGGRAKWLNLHNQESRNRTGT